jgi:hypothetical protein
MFHVEIVAIIAGSIGSVVGFLTYLWKRLIKPLVKLVNNHDVFIKSVDELREVMQKELSTNGGNSLKDALIDLRQTCHRIEKRQKIIEQRTKAALHYSNVALFETDISGRLVWSNVHLSDFLDEDTGSDVQGYDWLTIINEDEREEVLLEFKSCLNMNRKFSKITKTTDGKNIRMLGYPYRLNHTEHGGFLVSIIENNEV